MLENWKNASDEGDSACDLFMDLSKTFDATNYDLLLSKITAYGFSEDTLTLISSYLRNRKQKAKIHNSARTIKKLFHQDQYQKWMSKNNWTFFRFPVTLLCFYELLCLIVTIYDISLSLYETHLHEVRGLI